MKWCTSECTLYSYLCTVYLLLVVVMCVIIISTLIMQHCHTRYLCSTWCNLIAHKCVQSFRNLLGCSNAHSVNIAIVKIATVGGHRSGYECMVSEYVLVIF